jgi:DNA repair exonuclease SbcCD nuclease subunit
MKLAHLADVHLGFRQYHRLTPHGINQREADVAAAFRQTIEDIIRAAPDVVIIAGDLFNSVRPTNPAILHSFGLLSNLRSSLPATPVVLVAGNHDTPRSTETGTILKLFEAVDGVHVVADRTRDLAFHAGDLTIRCVPHVAWLTAPRPTLTPPRGSGRNIVVTHGEIAGVIRPDAWALEYGGALVDRAELHAERWDYVALGHYHVAHQVADNAWYSGALEYVSTNPWGELQDEAREGRAGQKGWLLVELGDGAPNVQFRPISLARSPIDLPAIHAAGLNAGEIDQQVYEHVDAVDGGIDNHIVRQLVFDVPRPVARDLNHARLRELKARALHFNLDVRRPPSRREVGVGAPGERRTLADVVTEYLSERLLDAEVPRDRLVALGKQYLEEVERGLLEE